MKKALALLLILILVIGAVPALTFASGTSGGVPVDESVIVPAAGALLLSPGSASVRGTESSEKEITAVRLLDGSKSLIAEGVADGDNWMITLPSDTDQDLIGRIGTSVDIFMQIEYNGVSLKQEDGYDDTGQDSWASGNILCGVSANSQKTFTVKAADGSTRDYTISIVYDESQGDEPVPGQFHISVSTPPGGMLTPSATTANEGDNIIVTVTPNEGYSMVDGSLSYTLNVAGGATVKITGNRFQMPNSDITLSCQWETASDDPSGEDITKGILSFVIKGRQADIISSGENQYVISVQMSYGTDITALSPSVIVSSGATLTPGPDAVQDFSQPVTYTAALPDGTVLTYVVMVSVSEGTPAERIWREITDSENQTPWWEYAGEQKKEGGYPKYW